MQLLIQHVRSRSRAFDCHFVFLRLTCVRINDDDDDDADDDDDDDDDDHVDDDDDDDEIKFDSTRSAMRPIQHSRYRRTVSK